MALQELPAGCFDDAGALVPDWRPRPRPFGDREAAIRRAVAGGGAPEDPSPLLAGRFCALVPLHPGLAEALFERFAAPVEGATTTPAGLWKYLPVGPFGSAAELAEWIAGAVVGDPDRVFMAVLDGPDAASAQPVGFLAYLRINPREGSIETGFITLSPTLQRSRIATEVHFLMMRHAFELGYRRYEWKCNANNLPSRRAAQRLGFSFEGVHRQAAVVKGRSRDTAWFSVLDGEWPALRAAWEGYSADGNFDASGRQLVSLSELTRPLLAALDPAVSSEGRAAA